MQQPERDGRLPDNRSAAQFCFGRLDEIKFKGFPLSQRLPAPHAQVRRHIFCSAWIAERLSRYACWGVVSSGCCDVSALRGAVFKPSPAPLPPPRPAIACTSCEVELELPMDALGGSAAKPPSCQSKPIEPNEAAPMI